MILSIIELAGGGLEAQAKLWNLLRMPASSPYGHHAKPPQPPSEATTSYLLSGL